MPALTRSSDNNSKRKILHIITGLERGGAETMLFSLLSRSDRERFAPMVVSLTDIGPVGDRIAELGIPLRALGMPRGRLTLRGIGTLIRWIREQRPAIVHCWMYHACLLGGIAARLAGRYPVLWGIHHTALDPAHMKRSTIWTAHLAGLFSNWASDRIIYCAETAQRVHRSIGYAKHDEVIANGFDLSRFRPDPRSRKDVREELEIPEDSILIGLVGRFDPLKDHATFLAAAALLHARHPNAHFLLCGDGVTPDNPSLKAEISVASLAKQCHFLGRREDIPRIQASLDIATSSSLAEAFPLAIGEAMACGVCCVVTDVGDSALLVGDTGIVVLPRNPGALAQAWTNLLETSVIDRSQRGENARRRVNENFDLQLIVDRYEATYEREMQSWKSKNSLGKIFP